MLHVVYRVGDVQKTKDYYTKNFGMKVLRERDVPEEKYSNCFLGYGPEQKGEFFSIELTQNYGVTKYDLGDGFNHMGTENASHGCASNTSTSSGSKTCIVSSI